jgi:hypothetical protein
VKKGFTLTIIYCVLLIIVAELLLRNTNKLKTYSEINFGKYQSPYINNSKSKYYLWNENDSIFISQPEFEFFYKTNSTGLVSKKDLDSCKSENDWVFIGDSFVFGIGAHQDSSMPVLFENIINSNKLKMCVINAGIPGSDPFYQAKFIKEYLLPRGFKNFLIAMNSSDIYDFIFRGGNERFIDNDIVEYRSSPWFEFFYEKSFIVRAFVHGVMRADYSLLPKNKLEEIKQISIEEYVELFVDLNMSVKESGGILNVVFHPYPAQYLKNNSKLFSEVISYEYLLLIHDKLVIENLNSFNLEPNFSKVLSNQDALDYFWKLDGHFNSKGYELYAKILFQEVFNDELTKAY